MTERSATSSRPAAHPAGDLIFLDRVRRSRSAVRAAPGAVRVLVADGQALVRAGFRALLEYEQRIVVVAEAASSDEALTLAGRVHPDVVLIDANLPGLDYVEVTRRMVAESGGAVMILTGSESDERIPAALRAGASGVLLKDADPAELVRAVELVARGEAQLSSRVTRRLIAELVAYEAGPVLVGT